MADELQGRQIAFVVLPEDEEHYRSTDAWKVIESVGGTAEPFALEKKRNMRGVEEVSGSDYDFLALPGRLLGALDFSQMPTETANFVKAFLDQNGLGYVIHVPWKKRSL